MPASPEILHESLRPFFQRGERDSARLRKLRFSTAPASELSRNLPDGCSTVARNIVAACHDQLCGLLRRAKYGEGSRRSRDFLSQDLQVLDFAAAEIAPHGQNPISHIGTLQ
jgi:hypothetical protein